MKAVATIMTFFKHKIYVLIKMHELTTPTLLSNKLNFFHCILWLCSNKNISDSFLKRKLHRKSPNSVANQHIEIIGTTQFSYIHKKRQSSAAAVAYIREVKSIVVIKHIVLVDGKTVNWSIFLKKATP